jgi:hypothetical protein
LLPFLNKQNETGVAGLIIKTRKPDEKPETNQEDEDKDAGMKACAQDLITAIHARDVSGVMEALKSAFEIADSEPHVEGKHIEPHSYDAQNMKAGDE